MIDFSGLKKKIYFPGRDERQTVPYVIYVLQPWGPNWIGNTDANALLAGDKKFYAMDRTQPYSDELLEACAAWKQRRDDVDNEFERLMMEGVRKP